MRLDTSQHQRMDMRLRMAPRMIQSMEILQLPLMALQERIDQELIENPILVDLREASTPAEVGIRFHDRRSPRPRRSPRLTPGVRRGSDDWSDSYNETHRLSRAALSEEADRKHDAMQNMASRPESLHDDLAHQLGYLECEPRSSRPGRVSDLQPRRQRLSSTSSCATWSETPEGMRLTRRLRKLFRWCRSSTHPAWELETFASACSYNSHPMSLAGTTPSGFDQLNHLDDIQQNRLPAIEKRTGIPIDDIKEAIEHLRRSTRVQVRGSLQATRNTFCPT